MQILKFLSEHQIVLAIAVSVVTTLGNWMYVAINNTEVQRRLDKADSRAVHRHIDSFAAAAAKFRDIGYAHEADAKENRRQVELLIECTRRKDCEKYPELLKVKEKPNVPPIIDGYDVIQTELKKANDKEE